MREARALVKDLIERRGAVDVRPRRGIEPTNNASERVVQNALWRKNSIGSASRSGSHFAERMITVSEGLRAQGGRS